MSGHSERRGVADAESWFALAQRAAELVDGARAGQKELVYGMIASEWRTKIQVPQRLVRCARFLAELGQREPALAEGLQTQPVAAVDFLNSWSRVDMEAATSAARLLNEGRVNLTGLKALESKPSWRPDQNRPGLRRWQAFVSRKVIELITAEFPGYEPIWNARGWGLPGPRINLKLPGPLSCIARTPGIHLAFDTTPPTEPLLVSIAASQAADERRPTVTTQSVFQLLGFRYLGYRVAWVTNVEAELEAFRDTLRNLGRVEDISTRLLDF